MSSCLEKRVVLVLNRGWVVHDTTTPQEALGQMATNAMVGLDIEGDYMNPVKWDDWLKLPVREQDVPVGTVRGAIRCPTVVVCSSFDKVLLKKPKVSKKAIYARDGGICQYTGKPLEFHESNLDHVMPASRGGATSFENIVLSHKKVNSQKDNKTPEEAGLKLLRKPVAPKELPPSAFIKNTLKVPEWDLFLGGKG